MTGDEEIDRIAQKLPRRVANSVVRKAMRKALRPVLDDARANAPRDTGEMRKRTKIKAVKRSIRRISLRVASEAKSPEGFYYPAIQDYGSEARGIPATGWMRNAYAKNRDSVRETARKEILAGVEREVNAMGTS